MPAPKARLLLIGNELTEGRLTDKNGRFLAQELSEMGFEVDELRIVPDDLTLLREAMRSLYKSGIPLILSAGGLGHTSDDLTANAWAEVLGDTLEVSSSLLAHLREGLRKRGYPELPFLEVYAKVPRKGEAIPNPAGLAPALVWEFPDQFVAALPGPPHELQSLWHEAIRPRLHRKFLPKAPRQVTFRTTGITESRLSEQIQAWEKQLPPSIHLSYGPSWEGVSLHLRAPADLPEELFTSQANQLRELLKPYLFAEGPSSLAEALLQALKKKQHTLAIAESCTGGHIAATLVEIPGASDVLLGGIVAYSNSAKETLLNVSSNDLRNYGAVSEPIARAMAEGVRQRFGAAYGIATTGIAGPSGGTDEKPVGTVWIGIATPVETSARKFIFPGDRSAIIGRATATALSLLWQNLHRPPQTL